MTLSINPYVKLIIWAADHPSGNGLIQDYGHVALETYTGAPHYLSTYMSFWNQGHLQCNISCAHFHDTQEEDNLEESKRTPQYYQLENLDIEKINAAFQKFQSKPNAWGALGYGIYGRAYSKSCTGLTMFLLEAGGIFNISINSSKEKIQKIAYTCFLGFFGLIFPEYNLISAFKIGIYQRPLKRLLNEYNQTCTRDFLPLIQETKNHTFRLKSILEFISNHKETIGFYQKKLEEQIENAFKYWCKLCEDYLAVDLTKVAITLSATQQYLSTMQKIQNQLIYVSLISITAVCICNFVNNRFISSQYSAREIRVLAEKVISLESKA